MSLRFTLTQHIRDKALLESMVEYFGCGRCYPTATRKEVSFIVSNQKEIFDTIIPLFQKYSLLGDKRQDFSDFVKVAGLLKSKTHLTKDGLELVNTIKSNMASRRKTLSDS